MTPPIRSAAGAFLLVLALLVSGCGGDDTKAQNEYVDKVNRIQTQFSSAYKRVAGQITSTTSAAEDRKTLSELQRTIEESAVELRAVKAPDNVKKLHSSLVDTLDGYGAQLAAASDDLLSSDRARVARATTTLATETADASADFIGTIADINQKLRD